MVTQNKITDSWKYTITFPPYNHRTGLLYVTFWCQHTHTHTVKFISLKYVQLLTTVPLFTTGHHRGWICVFDLADF